MLIIHNYARYKNDKLELTRVILVLILSLENKGGRSFDKTFQSFSFCSQKGSVLCNFCVRMVSSPSVMWTLRQGSFLNRDVSFGWCLFVFAFIIRINIMFRFLLLCNTAKKNP